MTQVCCKPAKCATVVSRQRKKTDSRAFTLIELLVALAIIAILASLGIALLVAARAKGQQTACLSNVRQLGQAMAMYVTDYDQHYPIAMDDTEVWTAAIRGYVRDTQIFQCPASGAEKPDPSIPQMIGGRDTPAYVTYIYNIHIGGLIASAAKRPDPGGTGVFASAIANPTRTVLLADGCTSAVPHRSPETWPPKPYTPMTTILLADTYYSGVLDANSGGPCAPRALHSGQTMVLYCDNHVKSAPIGSFYNAPERREVPGKQFGYSPCLDPLVGCLH